jgi:sugar O-acyltransferase (sialic acid O-acetyltransferase NeuD family)
MWFRSMASSRLWNGLFLYVRRQMLPPCSSGRMNPQPLYLLGAGGHAKMVIEACYRSELYRVAGCFDREPSLPSLLGVPVHSDQDATFAQAIDSRSKFLVAIGENALRQRLTERLGAKGAEFAIVIAPSAYVSPSARLGAGTVVMPMAAIGALADIGEGCIINTSSSIDHDGYLEAFAHVAPGCHLAGNVTVRTGAILGVGTSVIPNITIGEWAVIGAGTTVIRDIPARTKWVGCPARQIES